VQLIGAIDLTSRALQPVALHDTLYAIGDGQVIASDPSAPGISLGAASWQVPDVRMVDTPTVPPYDAVFETATASLAAPTAKPADAAAGPTIDDGIAAARNALASRLHVAAELPLVIAVETAPNAGGSAVGATFVLQVGTANYLYQLRADGSV